MNNSNPEKEIKVIDIVKLLLLKKRFILYTTILFFVIGIVVAYTSNNIYTSQTVFVLNTPSSSLSRFPQSIFPGLSNFGGNTETIISPENYKQIIYSYPFKKELLYSTILLNEATDTTTFFTYLNENYQPSTLSIIKKYTIGLPGVILSSGKTKNRKQPTYSLTTIPPEEAKLLSIIDKSIFIEIDNNMNSFTFKAEYTHPLVSAQMAQNAFNILENKIRNFQTKKESEKVKFIEKLKAEYKQKFESTQLKLARHTDYNLNISSAIGATRREKLLAEYEHLKFIYNDISQQLEKARIKLKEESQVFSVIEPVAVPLGSSRPNRPIIIVLSTLLGFVFSVIYILFKQYVLAELIKEL